MTKDEALNMALEALELHLTHHEHGCVYLDPAVTAIKEALAQPEQEPVAWKLVPIKPTDEMLKAMDECSTEGYDERLYAGHAASVFMAAVDVAPTPPQPWEKFCDSNCVWTDHHPDCKLAQRKPLTDEEIRRANHHMVDGAYDYSFKQGVKWAEYKHGIKGQP